MSKFHKMSRKERRKLLQSLSEDERSMIVETLAKYMIRVEKEKEKMKNIFKI